MKMLSAQASKSTVTKVALHLLERKVQAWTAATNTTFSNLEAHCQFKHLSSNTTFWISSISLMPQIQSQKHYMNAHL